jgi:peptide deformylase
LKFDFLFFVFDIFAPENKQIMILPIVAYGDAVLKKKAKDIDKDYPKLDELIANMYETMYGAYGVGLAAPQIGLPIRLFLVDTDPFSEDEDLSEKERAQLKGFKKTFINAQILEEDGDEWAFNEGCLSIPDVREDVFRQPKIKIQYQDENFETHIEEYDGLVARVIQHEYDHIEGILFTDKLSSFKKRLIKGKLTNISKGKIRVDYKMRFPAMSKKR